MISGRCRLVGSFLLHHRECHAHELAGDAREGDVVMLPVLALFPVVIVSEVGVVPPGAVGGLHEGPSQRPGPALRHVPVGSHGLAGLASRRVHAGVAHELVRAVEGVRIADLARDDGGEGDVYAGDGDEPLAPRPLQQAGQLPFDLFDLALHEVELLHQEPRLEGERPGAEPDAHGFPGERFEPFGLGSPTPPARRLPEDALERPDVGAEYLVGRRAVLQQLAVGRAVRVAEQAGELWERPVEDGRRPVLQGRGALYERHPVAGEVAQLLGRLVAERGGFVAFVADEVGYHRRIERVGLDLADRPDVAEGIGLDGVDHRGLVAMRGQKVEQGNPVVPRGLHSDQAVLRGRIGLAKPLQHLREAARRVVELERLDDGATALVDRAGDMASLGDIDPDADHGVLRSPRFTARQRFSSGFRRRNRIGYTAPHAILPNSRPPAGRRRPGPG